MKKLKKIFIVLENLEMQFLGYSDSLKQWFEIAENRVIVPFNGHDDYTSVSNVYNAQYDQYVTYKCV